MLSNLLSSSSSNSSKQSNSHNSPNSPLVEEFLQWKADPVTRWFLAQFLDRAEMSLSSLLMADPKDFGKVARLQAELKLFCDLANGTIVETLRQKCRGEP